MRVQHAALTDRVAIIVINDHEILVFNGGTYLATPRWPQPVTHHTATGVTELTQGVVEIAFCGSVHGSDYAGLR